jgi:hypothetical protein
MQKMHFFLVLYPQVCVMYVHMLATYTKNRVDLPSELWWHVVKYMTQREGRAISCKWFVCVPPPSLPPSLPLTLLSLTHSHRLTLTLSSRPHPQSLTLCPINAQ